MKVIKNINNNICLCLDSKGREVIAFGKGIGFVKPPHEIPLSRINRTFYNVKDNDFSAIKDIPIEVFNTAIEIVDWASDLLEVRYTSSAIISLADHIQFAIQRNQKSIWIDLPILQDIKQLYPAEMQIAYDAVNLINDTFHTDLQRNEAGAIALHLINDREKKLSNEHIEIQCLLDQVTKMIEEDIGFLIDRESFEYSRFAVHFGYLMKRMYKNERHEDQNGPILQVMIEKFKKNYRTILKITELLYQQHNIDLADDEKFYLLIYLNRMCRRQNE